MTLPIDRTPTPNGDRRVVRRSDHATLLERKNCDYVVAGPGGEDRRYFLFPTKTTTQKEALARATAEFERRGR